MKVSFQCRNCGHFEDSGNAGELDHPAACRTCGFGVSFNPLTGQKDYHPENWVALSDLSADELEGLGLKKSNVERHQPAAPASPGHEPQHITRSVEETLTSEDRPT